MSPAVEQFVVRMHQAENDLRRDVATRRRRWNGRIRRGRILFDREVRQAHRRFRQGIPSFVRGASVLNILSAPVLYSLILPLVLLDFWIMLYQRTCFPIYGIKTVRRRDYLAIDRHKLAYLNGIEKLNCTYCSYANGLLSYVREVAARTERYWCPIKHRRSIRAPHSRYHLFFDYGDAEGYRRKVPRAPHGPSRRRVQLKD